MLPTRHPLHRTIDDLTDMLDYGSEDIDDMDDDTNKEQGQGPPFTGRWTATSSYDVYMVDTPKGSGDDKEEPDADKTQSKRRRAKRRSKPRRSKVATLAPEKIVLRATPKTTKTLSELHPNRGSMTTGKTTLMNRP